MVPGVVEGIEGNVVGVAAGREHALVVTDQGAVYSWGGGHRKQDWVGRDGPFGRPARVLGALQGQHVTFVAAGEVRRGRRGWKGQGGTGVGAGSCELGASCGSVLFCGQACWVLLLLRLGLEIQGCHVCLSPRLAVPSCLSSSALCLGLAGAPTTISLDLPPSLLPLLPCAPVLLTPTPITLFDNPLTALHTLFSALALFPFFSP